MASLKTLPVFCLILLTRLAAQNAPNAAGTPASSKDDAQGTPATLACPAANQPLEDPVTFTWKPGSQTKTYRLLLGPDPGASRDGDSAIITGLQGQLAGLPPGQSLYVTLWSYDSSGKPVQPPSFCFIKTAPEKGVATYQELPETGLAGVSLSSMALDEKASAGAARACQQQCNLNAACQGYTYFPAANGNPAAMCDLKSQITASFHSECCVSAFRGAKPDAIPEPAIVAVAPPAVPPVERAPSPTAPAAAPADPFTPRTPEPVGAAPIQTPPAVAPPPLTSAAPAPSPVAPTPVAPTPVAPPPPTSAAPAPSPVAPTPVAPTPVAPPPPTSAAPAPSPVAPTPVAPTPVAPAPVAPAPVAPTPVAPTPVAPPPPTSAAPAPSPVAPAPVAPTPVAAAPAPSPVAPTPVAPTPVGPTPIAPTPVAPKAITRPSGVNGDWLNQFGAVSRLAQQGAAISGAYSDSSQPALSGAFQGTFDGKTLRATLTWQSGADSSHGTLLLTLTPDGRLDGTWTDANGVSGPWTMARRQ